MIASIVLAVLIPCLFVYCYKNAYKRPDKFPPGPPSLPVYGAFWIVLFYEFSNLALAFKKIGEKYKTKIIGLYMGPVRTVVLNDPADIKDMLNRDEFDGRVDIIVGRLRSYWKRLGIFFTDGYFWHVQRRFSLRYLRDYGFGRRDDTLESAIECEIKEMLDMRLSGPKFPAEKDLVNGELVYLPHFFAVPFINGLLQVLVRSTFPRSEYHKLWDLSRGVLLFQRSSNDMGGALSLTPWLKDIMPNYSGYNGLVKGHQYLLDFFHNIVSEAIATHDPTYDRHFLDMYIRKMKEEEKLIGRSTYSVDQLVLICSDYMFPTATAVEAVLMFLTERILLQPEIQDKIHEEIDRVVGRNRLPKLDDRRNMPYTEACIREMMRFETLVPLGVPHRATVDAKIGDYIIPEGTMVNPNLMMMNMDKDIWGDPENFRPERFIVNGQLNVALDKSLPFGAGKRLCAGETYARQAMFQVFAGFMQAFHISTADGRPLKEPAPRIQGIITTIPEFWLRVVPR
ncbi:hypothetical protein O3G_MSEX009197 [Manduca sexta]|uniref:Cytochrome P450 304a1 n=1 Tax=Manduca sexta TaxID=7130 RepID=A0A921ZD76_MANSE|nr:hypothetical protein O3G_MSEX009197 [Manduca sexta]KAG6455396.1 hypothetical protein O3G_MSEX009197 [Manduca sexta]